MKHLKFYGLPLKIFHDNYKIYPLISLYEIDQIELEKDVNYIMGTTNQLIWNESFENKKVDLMINIDKMEIIPFYKKNNKEIFECTKEEKDMFNIIENKLKDNNVNYNNTNWLNINEIDDEIDDFIRNEFTKYFKDLLIKLSLIQNIVNKNNIARLLILNNQKLDDIYSQSILDEKAIKSLIKKIIPNSNYITFISLFSQTKSFLFWLSDVSENLFYLSPYISSDKSITIYFEDGTTYIGTLNKGLFDGFGTLSSFDNKNLYTGEWKEGLKNGKGQLITEKIKYSGKFENDLFNGNKGVLCDEKGNIYEGDFVNGKFEGYGHYKMSNGDNYIGQFKNGFFDGKGQLTDKKGNVFNGNFVKGKREGYGLIVNNKGETIEGKYKDGIFFKIKKDNN